MPKLTRTFIDSVKPPPAACETRGDDRVPGYGVRVSNGGARSFVAQGRVKGKAIAVTIGRYGLFTEDQARRKAQSILQAMRDGVDPGAAKRAEAAERVTLGEVTEAYVNRPG